MSSDWLSGASVSRPSSVRQVQGLLLISDSLNVGNRGLKYVPLMLATQAITFALSNYSRLSLGRVPFFLQDLCRFLIANVQ